MFLKFYGLREQPFGVTPDPRFLYLSPGHREALASLYYGIDSERGFLALIGKPGTGKTTLLFQLLEKFRGAARTAFIFQTQCDSREFMRFLLAELGCETMEHDFVRMHDEFNKLLLQEASAGRRFIIVVDEAQNLDRSVLETIRLLSDFETPRAKLLQIVLSGQPELADKLASRKLSQLKQRISLLSGLAPLSVEESGNYVNHRLRIAGYSGDPLFTPEAMHLVTEFTEGIPRNLNNFCFNAMSLGCALQQRVIGAELVEEVIGDLDMKKHVTEMPMVQPSPLGPPRMQPTLGDASQESLSPEEAKTYMQELVGQLSAWKRKPLA
ncbi:MAG TPA: AAA family ATPase [Candidatus Aquilonibacter sp.]|nr:AAA family ATPase [Candidatus Aquilonibacter sp.]